MILYCPVYNRGYLDVETVESERLKIMFVSPVGTVVYARNKQDVGFYGRTYRADRLFTTEAAAFAHIDESHCKTNQYLWNDKPNQERARI